MLIEAAQRFELPYSGSRQTALAFVRTPAQALSQLRFIRNLQAQGTEVSGELVVPVAMLGDVDLPFVSEVELTPDGALLRPRPLPQERAWVEVQGQAQVTDSGQLHFEFQFRAHLQVPQAEGWGGAAFEKMVRAAAHRTLGRIAAALPGSLQSALEEIEAHA